MKYLITESQFDKVIFKFLDNQNFYVTRFGDDYNFWDRSDIENRNFDAKIIISTHKKEFCFVNRHFYHTLSSLFSLDRGDTLNFIGDWTENKTGFEFKNILIDPNT